MPHWIRELKISAYALKKWQMSLKVPQRGIVLTYWSRKSSNAGLTKPVD